MTRRLSLVLLAAGSSRRFGSEDKLLAEVRGEPLIRHALKITEHFSFHEVMVVVRPDHEAVAAHLPPEARLIVNPTPDAGMGTSLAVGIKALSVCEGAFIALADMPNIAPETFDILSTHEGEIIVPEFDGKPGHPVLFLNSTFAILASLTGDRGAKHIIRSGRFETRLVPVSDRGILIDVDSKSDLS